MPASERPLSDIFERIVDGFEHLLATQIRLIKVEAKEDLAEIAVGTGLASGGGALVAIGVAFLLLGIVYRLGLIIPLWAAALIVGFTVLLAGGFLVNAGRKRIKQILPLDRVTTTTKETLQWTKHQIN